MSSSVAPLVVGVPVAISNDAELAQDTSIETAMSAREGIDRLKSHAQHPSSAIKAPSGCERLEKLQAHPLSRTLPSGLARNIAKGCDSFPLRIVIVDNSGSMNTADGQRIIETPDGAGDWFGNRKSTRRMTCTRWQELGEDVIEMAKMATVLRARTDFHLLNPNHGYDILTVCPGSCSLFNQQVDSPADVETIQAAMRTSPCGTTPLTESVMRIASKIEPHAFDLRARGERVAVIIATDGLPNNRVSFVAAMQTLQRLPVWVIVRLCTSDDEIVEYWNDLDRNLESPLEVLDDLRSEAVEVERLNPWLTYGGPLHLCRLFGLPGRLFDAIDETSLVPFQIKEFVEDLLGVTISHDPQMEKQAFLQDVQAALAKVPPVLHPISLQARPWLNVNKLERAMQPQPQCVLL